jgi:hypothetical protein
MWRFQEEERGTSHPSKEIIRDVKLENTHRGCRMLRNGEGRKRRTLVQTVGGGGGEQSRGCCVCEDLRWVGTSAVSCVCMCVMLCATAV